MPSALVRSLSCLAAVACAVAVARSPSGGSADGAAKPPPATQPAGVARPSPEIPDGWELAPKAILTASQTPGEVIIRADGEHPTAGYETKLVESRTRTWPLQYLLVMKKPDGPAAAVVTPFEVMATFKTRDLVQVIIVTDGTGRHEVKVDQARD